MLGVNACSIFRDAARSCDQPAAGLHTQHHAGSSAASGEGFFHCVRLLELCFGLRKLVLAGGKGLWWPWVPAVTAGFQDEQDLFPFWAAPPESCSCRGYKWELWDMWLLQPRNSNSLPSGLGITGFLADQHLDFGLGRAGRALSSVINLVLAWAVWMRHLLSSAEMGETHSSSCSRV